MPRSPRHRLAVVAATIGAAASIAVPQWVAAGPSTPAADPASAPSATTLDDVGDVRAAPTSEAGMSDEGNAGDADATTPSPTDDLGVTDAVAPADAATPADELRAPVVIPEAPPAPPAPAGPPADDGPTAGTGTLTVEVAPGADATRTVRLQTADGTPVGESHTVTGTPVVFADLGAGAYDLLVEQFADGGGAFVTRTPIIISTGDDVVATCDAETLDCSAH